MTKKKQTDETEKPEKKPVNKAPKKETVDKDAYDLMVLSYKDYIKKLKLLSIGAVAAAFFFGTFVQGNIDRICDRHQDRQEKTDPGTSISRFCTRERPTLSADYQAVGGVLADTSRRLRRGTLSGLNDSIADTIARIQPVVSDASEWRTFVLRLATQIQGGNAEQIATQFDEAARAFGVSPVSIVAPTLVEPQKMEVNDEKVDTQNSVKTSGDDGSLGDEGRDENQDKPDDSGENSGAVQPAEKPAGGTGGRQDKRGTTVQTYQTCPGGNCQNPGYYGGAW